METTFAELPLGSKLQAAITAAGYSVPTPIQAQAIPVAVTGCDILGIAQTGTGKTASFVLPMIQRLESGRARARMPRSLILAPTRELAAQVAQSFEKYGINHKLDVALLIGGVSMDDQVKKLDRGVDVLIATPGRLLDHYQRGRIMLMGVEILVIDEADRMLDMGFIPDIEKICKLLPPKRQTLFFSATMPTEITRLVNTFLKDPVRIEVARPATTAKTITQLFRFCPSAEDWEKREILRELIQTHPVKNAIIFCNRKRDVAILHKSLLKHGFNAGALHGDMEQNARTETLDKFRNGEILLLAASDVAARGLDIPDVSHVFNFDIPWAGDDYVHRIGRTGRAGKEGASLSLVTPDDLKLIKDIEKVTGEAPVWIGELPTEADFADSGKRKRKPPARGADRGADRGASRGAARGSGRGGDRGEPHGGERGEPRQRSRSESDRKRGGAGREGHDDAGRVAGAVAQPAGGTDVVPAQSRVVGRRRGGPGRDAVEGGDRATERTRRSVGARDAAPVAPASQASQHREVQRGPRRAVVTEAIPGFGDQPVIGGPEHAPERAAERATEHAPERATERATERAPEHRRQDERTHGDRGQSQRGQGDRAAAARGTADRGPADRGRGDRHRSERPHGDRMLGERQPNDRASERPQQRAVESVSHSEPRVERPVREPRSRKPEPAGGHSGSVGFADNVPAFLRRPVRSIKVANE